MEGKIYKHFKGNLYRLLHIAYDSETMNPVVVYQALYGDNKIWVRPYDMFFGYVEREGEIFKRFTLVEE